MDFSAMSPAEQAHMNRIIERKQMQDFMRMYSSLVERCFNSCCNDFTSKALSSKEVHFYPPNLRDRSVLTKPIAPPPQEQCVLNCTDKFLKHSERVGARFAEHNAEMMGANMNK
ncbi:hypothetical protein ONZ51_g297 [Trametes cubensis]|uniref:Mitochondrial import inner membrane translocase subunit n=1 Tax=Trametes cubensis TaxID=1111947 RepID=A0AAD7U3M6_9APHY|nr:hypothetical protein ONZ51_g297 [Trametes cubensis]